VWASKYFSFVIEEKETSFISGLAGLFGVFIKLFQVFAEMGTEFLYKMYIPSYHSTRDLDDSSGDVRWPSHHENKAFGQYHDMLAAKPEIDRYSGYDKEHLRQTILRHENTFKHQVCFISTLYC